MEKAPPAGQIGLTGGTQPIFPKKLRSDPTVWKTCLRLLMELQSTNMLKLYTIYGWSFFIFQIVNDFKRNLKYLLDFYWVKKNISNKILRKS
jgi:hypothetical protein